MQITDGVGHRLAIEWNILVFSDEISEGYLIAVCEDNQSQPIASQRLTGNEQSAMTPKSSEFFFGRRGDLGTRPVPSMKLPAPLKRRTKKKSATRIQNNTLNRHNISRDI